jgi:intracellular multiplication protein IcmV
MAKTKEKKESKVMKVLASRLNIRAWGDADRIKSGAGFIGVSLKRIFSPDPNRPVETFEAAQKRLKLTDKDLLARQHSFLRFSVAFLVLAIGLFLYAIYHFIFGTVHAGILTSALTMVAAAMAVRYHFWYFQIKCRKLGCTFNEWFHEGLMGKKS